MTFEPLRHSIEASMFVRQAGPQAADVVLVWIHGLGESGLCFEAIVSHAALAGYLSLVPDLPGYGRSPWASPPLSLGATADLLSRWLEARGERDVVLVGHSMGGVVATMLAERLPLMVRGVIDVDGNLSVDDCTYSARAAAQPLDEFVAPGGGYSALQDDIYRAGVDDEALRGYYVALRLADPRVYHAHSRELVSLSGAEGLAARLAALRAPKTYIAGVPRGASARSLELLEERGVEWRGVEPSGHWPFLDQPDHFATKVVQFVEDVVLRQAR